MDKSFANPMSLTEYLNHCDLDVNVKNKLSQHFIRTENGISDILMTPMAKDGDPDKLLSEFDEVFNTNRSKMNNVLLDLEGSNRAKIGPRSIAVPWDKRRETLIASFEGNNNSDSTPEVKPLFGKSRLRPVSVESALTLLKNNTNSGLPYYTRKGLVKKRVLDRYDKLMQRKDPCILFTRTQEQNKTRNVWGYPMIDTLNEMRYYSPLLKYQRLLGYRSALQAPEMVDRSLTELILDSIDLKAKILSIDFSAYDNTISPMLIKVAFDYIRSLFQSNVSVGLDYIEDRFKTIEILTPDGIYSGCHGIPSGSTFTNEVGSVIQASIRYSCGISDNFKFQVQGDDGVYSLQTSDVNKLVDSFESNGLKVNRGKSYLADNYAIYLQNLYHIDYIRNNIIGGIYPVYRALNRIMYQERWSTFEDYEITGKDYYSIRTICIVENCKHHPLFKELVKFVIKHDKYSLDVTDQGIVKYVQMVNETKGAGEILNHQYGDDVAGIRSFETFKMIKELS